MTRTGWAATGLVSLALLTAACVGRTRNNDGASSSAPVSDTAASGAAETTTRAAAPPQSSAGRALSAPTAAPQVAGGGSSPGAGAPLPGTDRKLVMTAFLDVTLRDVQAGFERIGAIAEANGGLVAESAMRQEGKDRRGTITIRVPVDRYSDVLGQLRGVAARVDSERTTANDVSEEFTDLQARQRNLEATEQQLLVFLGQAKNVQEVLQVQDRLTTTRAEIERLKGRINLLTRMTDLATIQMSLRSENASPITRPDGIGPLASLQRGWEASLRVLGGVGSVALTAVAFSWWLLPLAALGAWVGRRQLRRRSAPLPPAEA